MLYPRFDSMIHHRMRYQELVREAQQHRLIKEAFNARRPQSKLISRILLLIGKMLKELGASLEERYSSAPRAEAQVNFRASTPKGC